MEKIYRVEIYAYGDGDEKEVFGVSNFYLRREDAVKEAERINKMSHNELNKILDKVGGFMVDYDFGLDKAEVEEYDLMM